jgi:hypothetical protein
MLKTVEAVLFLCAGLGVLLATPTRANPVEIVVGVADNLAPRIVRSLKQHPNACEDDDFFSPDWLRTTLEFFIVCRAIRTGGVDAAYSFRNYPNSARARAELKKGTIAIMVDLPWGDFGRDESLFRSSAVLPVGSFVKGIYTRPGHTALLGVRTLEKLRAFTAVSSRNWVYDWAALKRMKIETINVAKYVQMGDMVRHRRVDFFVGEFPGTEDLSQYVNGERFVPVPGVKIVLPGSRHLAVSKRFPHAKRIFDAAENGLKALRERGLIKKGYQTSGFFNPAIKDWKALCCE